MHLYLQTISALKETIHFKVLNASSLAIIIGISADYLTINGN